MSNLSDLIARILISSVFLFSGVNKILKYDSTVIWMESFGMPGMLLVPAIIIEIIFPIFIIVGYRVKVSASILSFFSILTAFIFHFDFSNQMQVISFLKNLGLAGGLIFLMIHGPKNWVVEKKKKFVRL